MQPTASHLYRSRHGIWYFRWIVPQEFRQRHPELPKELKKSTATADKRRARAVARRLHCALLLRYAIGTNMSFPLDAIRYAGWTLKRDPKTDRITELTVGPEDTPAMLARLDRVLDIEAARSTPAAVAPKPVTARAPAAPTVLLSEAVARYSKFQIQTEAWTENTFTHTHGPSLRLFRELVGQPMEVSGERGGLVRGLDLPLSELTRARIETFVEEFWDFPAQQGKRAEGRTAREILAAGGVPQSRANVFKRLAHVRQFLSFCVDKEYVGADVVREIDLVLAKDTARAREKAAIANAGADGVVSNGYVAFSYDDLRALFGPEFARHADGNPARFWIPLLALYAGLRVGEASQLKAEDFVCVDGVDCVRVTGESVGHSADSDSQRVKTLASLRVLPLHPKLIELGLLNYVEARRDSGDGWMWDGLLWTAKSGFGKYPSRDFQKLAIRTGVYQTRRKVFHSFRSTIYQELERQGLEGELIDRFLGHEVNSTRAKNYSRKQDGRAFPVNIVLAALSKIDFPILTR